MKNSLYSISLICLIFYSCNMEPDKQSIEKWKQEILDTEQKFAEMAKEEGIHNAFIAYASEDAVLMRNNTLILGKKEIDLHLKDQISKGLSWKPDFVEVASSGDLGYTYGQYTYSDIDSEGKVMESTGVFHTVWKRQADGEWRFVWD